MFIELNDLGKNARFYTKIRIYLPLIREGAATAILDEIGLDAIYLPLIREGAAMSREVSCHIPPDREDYTGTARTDSA